MTICEICEKLNDTEYERIDLITKNIWYKVEKLYFNFLQIIEKANGLIDLEINQNKSKIFITQGYI